MVSWLLTNMREVAAMITCPDCRASVRDEHDACPVCGGLLHISEEQRAVAHVAEAERARSSAREAGDAIARKDQAEDDRSLFTRLTRGASDILDSL
jgi:hypothetical protein